MGLPAGEEQVWRVSLRGVGVGVSFVSSFGELPSIYPQKSLFFIGNMFDFKVWLMACLWCGSRCAGWVWQVWCSA